MLSSILKERLKDPDYLELHLLAVSVFRATDRGKWYDTQFLTKLEAARRYLAQVAPRRLEEFEAGFEPLFTPRNAPLHKIEDFFDAATRERVKQIAANIPGEELEKHEVERFGRLVVHDNPYFSQLQADLTQRVSQIAGESLEPSYNFLSMYDSSGVCRPHLDQPISTYTLDYCIDQSAQWPIYFSEPVAWPTYEEISGWSSTDFLASTQLEFSEQILRPNDAILFCGSSRWHYRKPMPVKGFCNLLFLHYYPAGCAELVDAGKWHRYFGWEELEPLCDLFGEVDAE